MGVIKEADACGVRVSLNGDSLALPPPASMLITRRGWYRFLE
jgi:hypothetical protein